MQAKSHIEMRAGPLLTDTGYSLAEIGWRKAIIIIAAAVLVMLLIMQLGKAGNVEKRAELAFSRAWHLLQEADKENRGIRPMPLSLVKIEFERNLG
jgi:hypothetical protein